MNRQIAEVDYGKFMLFANHNDHISRAIESGNRWEPDILVQAERFIKPGMSVMDIGANMGTFAVRAAQLVGPSGTVYAFEPQRVIYQQLCGNIFLNGLHNVHAYNYAVGDKSDSVELSYVNYDGTPDPGGVRIGGESSGVFVESISIDSLSIPHLDVIKIDVERYEPYVFQGMKITVYKSRPVIFFELTTLPLDGYDRDYPIRWLEHANYTVTCINETTFDYLAVPNEV